MYLGGFTAHPSCVSADLPPYLPARSMPRTLTSLLGLMDWIVSQALFIAMMPPLPMPTTRTSTSISSGSPTSGFAGGIWNALTAEASDPPATRASCRACLMAIFTALLVDVAPAMASTAMDWLSMMRGNMRSLTFASMTSVSPWANLSSGTSILRIDVSFTVMVTGSSQICQYPLAAPVYLPGFILTTVEEEMPMASL